MQINSQTPQDALERLYRAVTRRELLKDSPLNLRRTLRFALLFLMFPGMICGFWVGLGLTLVFCVALLCLLGTEHTPEAVLATQVWLVCGCGVFVYYCGRAVYTALAMRRRREQMRPAEPAGDAEALPCGEPQKVRWCRHTRADGTSGWVAELRFHAPAAGIHAFLISLQEAGRHRFLTVGQQGMCTVHSVMNGGNMQALLLYKLAAGQHTLRWMLEPPSGAKPATEITLLCRP